LDCDGGNYTKWGQEAAPVIGVEVFVVRASNVDNLDGAFTALAQRKARAVIIGSDTFFSSQRSRIAALAARRSLPTMGTSRLEAEAGGLMCYGANIPGVYCQAGVNAGQILKGANPANLPVQLPIKFDLVINLQTAKSLGLEVPPTLIARADEVIEEAYALIEQMYPELPKIELFARQARPGWSQWGNEIAWAAAE
jgi:putative ABC transport system substrate-binding protein